MVRIGMVGLGGRGYGLLNNELVRHRDVQVVAVCDTYQDRIEKAQKLIKKKNGNNAVGTTDYMDIVKMENVDIVFIAAAWEAHVDIAVAAMKNGKFTAMEVGGAYNVDDCWRLVDTYEETKTPFFFLENCCYGKYEMMCLEMVKKGLFGEVVSCAGAYIHDLREEVSSGKEKRHYRLNNYINRNCENYPTHELGPIAKVLNINRGNRMVKLTSFDSPAKGLHQYVLDKKSDDKELVDTVFKQGDVITTLIKCENGETIFLKLATTLPACYSRSFTVEGTKATYREDGNIFFDNGKHLFEFNQSKHWNNAKKTLRLNKPEIWKDKSKLNMKGHGGMDSLVVASMVDCYKNKTHSPIDVYDAAAWMAVTALSEQSINGGNITVEVPDFTRGKYKNREDIPSGDFAI